MEQANARGTLPDRSSSVALLTLGGVLAAFGAASCCGLPILLATAGLGSAWLTGIALVAAPYRADLLLLAAAGLASSAYLLLWRLRPSVCKPDSFCVRPLFRMTIIAGLIVGLGLLYLGYTYV